eukprot:15308-Chlamydomonas_euryale.AAC.2
MDIIPAGHDNPTLSTLEARTGPHVKCSYPIRSNTGLDNEWLVRIILPIEEALCLAREKSHGDSEGVELV